MKLRKWIALLLACLTLSTAALAFADDAAIGKSYQAAVKAMAERGVLNGYTDGKYHPDDTLTREQGAKIIACLVLGSDAAQALTGGTSAFSDVLSTRWSAPYINWCVEQNILNGYGNGKFGPTDSLTGDQFAKMLLCALGLGRKDAGAYTGSGSWYLNVREDAASAKLYTGDAAMKTDRPITRAQAALLCVNAAQAKEAPATTPASSSGSSSSGSSSSGSSSSGSSSSGSSSSGSSSGTTPTPAPEPMPEEGTGDYLPVLPPPPPAAN